MAETSPDTYFVVHYRDAEDGKVRSLKATRIGDSTLGLTFVEISGFLFHTDGPVVNPEEESLAKKFATVRSLHLSLYSIYSIEEVGMNHGGFQFKKDRSNLVILRNPEPPAP